jgi:hypothetical protein
MLLHAQPLSFLHQELAVRLALMRAHFGVRLAQHG